VGTQAQSTIAAKSSPETGDPRAAVAAVSLLRFSPLLIVLLALVADARRATDPDLWGHVRFGQMLLRTGRLPSHDPFSYSAPGHLWLHHEWLSEVALAWVYDHFGVIGLKLMKLACAGVTVTCMALAGAETGAPVLIQFLVLLAATMLMAPSMQYRPQLFDFMFLSAILALLARDNARGRAPLWLAIPILALWANFHGGFFLGIAAMLIYSAVVAAQELYSTRQLARAPRLFAITAMAAIATAVTFAIPYARQSWYTLWYSLANPMTRHVISDWGPLTAVLLHALRGGGAGVYFSFAAAFFIAGWIAIARWPCARNLPLDAIGAAMTVAAFMAVRNIAVGAIAMAAPLMRHLAIATGAAAPGTSPPARNSGSSASPASGLTQVVLAALAVILAVRTGLISSEMPAIPPTPSGAVAFMGEHGLHGNVLNNFVWGEYLIWHLASQSKIFIDGRYDLAYSPRVVSDYVSFIRDRPGADAVLTGYPHDFVLISPDDGAEHLMVRATDWTVIYRDPDCILYARKDSGAARIAGVPVIGRARTPDFFP
jgi:hypothetical protein